MAVTSNMKSRLLIIILICCLRMTLGQSYKFETLEGVVYISDVSTNQNNQATIRFVDNRDSLTIDFNSNIVCYDNYLQLDNIHSDNLNNNDLKTLSIHFCKGEKCETVCHAFSYDKITTGKNEPDFMETEKFKKLYRIIQNGTVIEK
ncbi:MAG: hypothetical protein CMI36_09340 [Owenweeksia sp.]|nr:hypothetical protein [Owenweeksia sp.]MBF99185.1 hypothetical protein [Owenweeksia sp.]HBF19296.1 hypothetical protein [Cryomorphaceae bacterium]HCQ15471.1 hypothetical protein [Cryomorphaceae bacterium]